MNPAAAVKDHGRHHWEQAAAVELFDVDHAESVTRQLVAVARAWRAENLDGKATLRAIIADGRWPMADGRWPGAAANR